MRASINTDIKNTGPRFRLRRSKRVLFLAFSSHSLRIYIYVCIYMYIYIYISFSLSLSLSLIRSFSLILSLIHSLFSLLGACMLKYGKDKKKKKKKRCYA